MIRLCKYVYINLLTVIFFCVCFASGRESFFIISYSSMLLHELAHLIASIAIGLKPSRISLHPFGVNLRLKSKFIYGLADEMILYLSGPLINLIIAFIAIAFFKNIYAFTVNISLFTVNMLPILPLDGGCIIKKLISYYAGEVNACKFMKIITVLLAIGIFAGGLYAIYVTGYNYSVIFMSILIMGNVFTAKEKYSADTINGLIHSGEQKLTCDGTKLQMYAINNSFSPTGLIKYIRPGKYTCIAVIDEGGHLEKIITETELSDLIKNNTCY